MGMPSDQLYLEKGLNGYRQCLESGEPQSIFRYISATLPPQLPHPPQPLLNELPMPHFQTLTLFSVFVVTEQLVVT